MDRRSFLISFAGSVVATRAAATARGPGKLACGAELDELIGNAMRRLAAAAGLAVAVYSREGAYARGFGVTDVTTREPVTTDTAFYIASSTKALTALALASAAARGKIDLGMSLGDYAPDARFPASVQADRVTFRHLLSHTSGISNDPIAFRLAFTGQHDPRLLWRLLGVSSVNTDAPLGTFEYTNTGYNVATILTDRHMGLRWEDLLDRELFQRAGMSRSSARMSRARAAGWSLAKPHVALPEGIRKIYLDKTDSTMQSAGGVVMSANDAVRWLEMMVDNGAVRGRQVVDPGAVAATRARLAAVDAEFDGYHREAYGLGWYHVSYRGEPMLQQFGGFAGFRTHVSYLPARKIGVAAFVNDSSAATQLTDAIANYVYDRTGDRPDARQVFEDKVDDLIQRRDQYFAQVRLDRAKRAKRSSSLTHDLSAYAGAYENRDYGRIDISSTGRELNVRFGVMHAIAEPYDKPDSIRVELVPQSGEVMSFEGDRGRPLALRYDDQLYERV
jgi:CubicO group peptidase (beta-lactamase class C family)